jgi:pantoate--beta-alanine ligase
MQHVETIAEVRELCDRARRDGSTVGLVPTMGYLHDGHRSLIRAAREGTDFVVVSIFVNPLQFGPNEDLDRYPRDLTGDLAQCADEGVDCVFAPPVSEMYPRSSLTRVHVAQLTEGMCGAARPTHFDGVTTVVTKLFSIIGPSIAFFGRKDAQQLAVVTRMTADLNLPVEVVGCPLVREPDGLALSSRNAYLSPQLRAAAPVLFRALQRAADAVVKGERDATRVRHLISSTVDEVTGIELEYVDVRDAHELVPLMTLDGDVLVALAAHAGATRLIDNVGLAITASGVKVDSGRIRTQT